MDDTRIELDNFDVDRRPAASPRADKHGTARRVRAGASKRAGTGNRRQTRRGRTHAGALADTGIELRASAEEERSGGVAESLQLFLLRARRHPLPTAAGEIELGRPTE